MATKQGVNKSQAVIDYLKAHPGATPSEIASALSKQGIDITTGYVATVTMQIRSTATPLPKPAEPLTLDQIKMVAQAIKRIRLRSEAEEVRAVDEGASLAFWRM